MRSYALALGALAFLPGTPPLVAQTAESAAAATITPEAIARYVSAMAADSMQGRDTPSQGLERTARYVAAQFADAGLEPAGKGGRSWFWRYPVPSRLDASRSRVVFHGNGDTAYAGFVSAAYLETREVPNKPARAGVLLVAGRHTLETLAKASGRGKVVLYLPPPEQHSQGSPPRHLAVRARLTDGNKGLLVVSESDSLGFARALARQQQGRMVTRRNSVDDWVVQLRLQAAAKVERLLSTAGLNLARLRGDTMPILRELPLEISFEPQLDQTIADSVELPNVAGRLAGSDTARSRQYVLFVAHMDHVGMRPEQPDSIANGANDNASGVAGLIALAKAYAHPGARPPHSLWFVVVSGGAKDFWGSRAIAEIWRASPAWGGPGLRGVLNLDMIGRPAGDTLAIAGLNQVELSTPLAWIIAAHPELGLTVIDGGTPFRPTSDHFPFVEAGVPSLSFHNGQHADAIDRADTSAKDRADTSRVIDAEQAARIVRLAFHVGLEMASTAPPPRWTAESRAQLLEVQTP